MPHIKIAHGELPGHRKRILRRTSIHWKIKKYTYPPEPLEKTQKFTYPFQILGNRMPYFLPHRRGDRCVPSDFQTEFRTKGETINWAKI